MKTAFLWLLLVGLVGVACGDTVPLDDRDQNGGGDAGSGNLGGSQEPSGTAGDRADAGGPTQGGGAATAMGGNGASAGTPGSEAGQPGSDGGSGALGGSGAGGEGTTGPTHPPICVTASGDPVVGGSRLKALCVKAEDGSQILKRGKLFDSELATECKYHLAADGARRCLPILHAQALIAANTGFSDAACSERVAYFDPQVCTEALPRHVYLLEDVSFCLHVDEPAYRAHVFELGSFVQPAQVYTKAGNDCVAAGKPLNKVIYAVGPELPASTFIEGTTSLAP